MRNIYIYRSGMNYKQGAEGSLAGKVVLMIGNDSAVLQSLVIQLAQKGADIALVCWQLSKDTVQQIQDKVERLGRRFVCIGKDELVPMDDGDGFSVHRLIHLVTVNLGRLDVFIDLSAKKATPPVHIEAVETESNPLAPNWQLRQAVIEKLVHA